ncbi:hypothetical protein Goshw_003501 [Gossypium schwendimanii]|uniref:Uncharacterized protein n=1 Tax=Gossypium schwendimanii TaxID=34291 RepID=A0A7J9LTX8_GOSSC|nr:hypothetical protein [Gossypium schwendimanii]
MGCGGDMSSFKYYIKKTNIIRTYNKIVQKMLKLNHARPSGKIRGKNPPPGQCNLENVSNCCEDGKFYMTYKCSPPMLSSTKAMLTLNNFEAGGDGSGPSECKNQYHSNDYLVVALLTGWFNYGKRCLKYVNIRSNGKSVRAVIRTMNIGFLILIILLIPRKQFGRLLEDLKVIEVK